MMYGNHMGGGGWAISIIVTVILVGLTGAAVVWLASRRRGSPPASAGAAGEILDRRLASGEITSEQYQELRETLGSAPRDQQPPSPVGTPG
jgi:uncharacterized membrane protein